MIYPPVPTVTLNSGRAEKCSEGYTGRIQYKWEIYYTNDVYYTTYSDGTPATVTQSTPHQREVLDYNSCTLIPTQGTESKSGVQEQTCDSYYNAPSGTYYGSVYKYGTYQSTYNSGSKSTGTVFNVNSIDATSCKSQITSLTKEEKTETCPSGQTGSIKYYRFYGTNSVGQKVYPYEDTWLVENNNCADSNSSDPTLNNDTDKPSGLLSNISITSSQLQNDTAFNNYLNALETAEWKSTESHKLILDIDDLSVGKYDAQKIGTIVRKYETVVGINNSVIEIKIPNTADKFIGRGDISQKSLANKTVIVKNAVLEDYTVRVNYLKFKSGTMSSPDEQTTSINIVQ